MKLPQTNLKSKLDKYLILSGIIGPALFFLTVYFVFPLFIPGYNIVNQYISELGAQDSPIKTITNVFGFSLFGISIMLFSLGVLRSKQLNKFAKISSFFIFLSGVLVYLVGIFPCDSGCQNFSTIGILHEISSIYPFPALAIAYIIIGFGIYPNAKLRFLTPIIFVFGTITLILAYFSILYQAPVPAPGILQRAAIGLPYVIMMVIGYTLYRNQ
jgi:hypothetical membrane protein